MVYNSQVVNQERDRYNRLEKFKSSYQKKPQVQLLEFNPEYKGERIFFYFFSKILKPE